MDIVTEVLKKSAAQKDKFKPVTVEKHLELDIDLGLLLACDSNDLNLKKLRLKSDEYLQNLARDNAQLLFNKIWELPTERVEEAILAKLPAPKFVLPRQLPLPKPKPLTKWQKFAQEKGIKKIKKPKLTWDDVLKQWIPRYGYKRAIAKRSNDWIVEVPQNADPYEDMFEKIDNTKKEKVAKNEFQRLRNIASSKNIKVPSVGLPPTDGLNAEQLGAAVSLAKVSTASIGKFQPSLPKEKKSKSVTTLLPGNRKRKQPTRNPDEERKANKNILDGILNKKPKIDIDRAVNLNLHQEQHERSEEKKKQNPKKKGHKNSRRGKYSGKSASKKPLAGKGQRKMQGTGRKRR